MHCIVADAPCLLTSQRSVNVQHIVEVRLLIRLQVNSKQQPINLYYVTANICRNYLSLVSKQFPINRRLDTMSKQFIVDIYIVIYIYIYIYIVRNVNIIGEQFQLVIYMHC